MISEGEATIYKDLLEGLLSLKRNGIRSKYVADNWQERIDLMIEHAVTKPLQDFLIWTADVDAPEWNRSFSGWYREMMQDSQRDRWLRLSRKRHGKQFPFSEDAGASPLTVQHAYHLYAFEKWTGHSFWKGMDTVVEVGGGFGNFAAMLREDGFRGRHVIWDLPEISEIQKAFLRLNGIRDFDGYPRTHSVQRFTGDNIDYLHLQGSVAFVATWSLSETPLKFRELVFPKLHFRTRRYLLAYQRHWSGVDNVDYFARLMKQTGEVRWWASEVPGNVDPPNESSLYAFGVRT